MEEPVRCSCQDASTADNTGLENELKYTQLEQAHVDKKEKYMSATKTITDQVEMGLKAQLAEMSKAQDASANETQRSQDELDNLKAAMKGKEKKNRTV